MTHQDLFRCPEDSKTGLEERENILSRHHHISSFSETIQPTRENFIVLIRQDYRSLLERATRVT